MTKVNVARVTGHVNLREISQVRISSDIDGLRALAVLGVIIYHAKLYFDDTRVLPGGYLGVDVFCHIRLFNWRHRIKRA